jgi:hypothetical protein
MQNHPFDEEDADAFGSGGFEIDPQDPELPISGFLIWLTIAVGIVLIVWLR